MIPHPDREVAVQLIKDAIRSGARIHMACKEMEIDARTYYRWHQGGRVKSDGRPVSKRGKSANALSHEEKARIVEVCNEADYKNLPPSQIVPMLADRGIYLASESSFYRILKAAKQLHRRGKASNNVKRHKPAAFKASKPNQVWSWDITFLPTLVSGQFYRLYLIMDIYSRKIVGWEVHEKESAELAGVLAKKACLAEGVIGTGVVLHSDNGSPMKGAMMLATLQKLGVMPSFSRPSVSDDNPYSESLFKTLKYTPAYPAQPFADIDQARSWVLEFVTWYNTVHRHSGIRFVTPAQRHSNHDVSILHKRHRVYQQAKANNPSRWSGQTRNWQVIGDVCLNPNKKADVEENQRKVA